MKTQLFIFGILLVLLVSGCISISDQIGDDTSKNDTLLIPQEEGVADMSFTLLDKSSGELILMPSEIDFTCVGGYCEGTGGINSYSSGIMLIEDMKFGKYEATVRVNGYSYKRFEFIVNADAEPVTLYLEKGVCSDSCENPEHIKELIEREFGLSPDEYSIECVDCLIGRGGSFKARILYNQNPLELYYRSGRCSSGGTDCGWDVCFTSFSAETEELYDNIKQKFCSEISSKRIIDDNVCTYGEEYDNTSAVQALCLEGEFEEIEDSKKTISIKYNSNRCWSETSMGIIGCFDN